MTATLTRDEIDVEKFIDSINPADMRDGVHLRSIAAARDQVGEAQDALVSAIRAARAAGDSWAMIGLVLRTSRQNAHRKYARLVGE